VQLYENGKAAQGESFTFKEVFSSTSSDPSTEYSTRYYQTVNADHSGLAVDTRSNPMNGSSRDRFAPDGSIFAAGATEPLACTFLPAAGGVPGTLTLGATWDSSWTRTCTYGSDTSTDNVRTTGSATALETVTVAAGTFQTIKLETTQVENRPAGSGLPRWNISGQCWIDVVMGVPVKCMQTLVKTPPDPKLPTTTSTSSSELVSYDAARFPGSSKNPARFAGGWNVSMRGTNAGSCSSVEIDISGKLTGSCSSARAGGFQIDGSVDADGVLTAGAQGGITISAKLTPVDGNGEWSADGGSGTWSMVHR
jgi:hypothetical protein